MDKFTVWVVWGLVAYQVLAWMMRPPMRLLVERVASAYSDRLVGVTDAAAMFTVMRDRECLSDLLLLEGHEEAARLVRAAVHTAAPFDSTVVGAVEVAKRDIALRVAGAQTPLECAERVIAAMRAMRTSVVLALILDIGRKEGAQS